MNEKEGYLCVNILAVWSMQVKLVYNQLKEEIQYYTEQILQEKNQETKTTLTLNQNEKKVKSCLSETQEKENKNVFLNLPWEINTEVIFRLGLETQHFVILE